MSRIFLCALALIWMGLLPSRLLGYPVAAPPTVKQLVAWADLIVKVKVISEAPAPLASLPTVAGLKVMGTRLRVISMIKGEAGGDTILFRHYALDAKTPPPPGYPPQYFNFSAGESYLLFAGRTDQPATFTQIIGDAALVPAVDDKPVEGKSVLEIYWADRLGLALERAVGRRRARDPVLDRMSSTRDGDFDRRRVIEALRPLLASKDQAVVSTAIDAASSHNPFMPPDNILWWLDTVGHGHMPGLAKRDPNFDNLSGRLLWPELGAIADGNGTAALRANAILAMGRSRARQLPAALDRWAHSGEPLIRRSAMILLGDVVGDGARAEIARRLHDSSPLVREGAAAAIGIGQIVPLIPSLADLLKDADDTVRTAAARSLVSFSLDDCGTVLRANMHNPEFGAVFVNDLASQDSAPYLSELANSASGDQVPALWGPMWGGTWPPDDSWAILFGYVAEQPDEAIASRRFNSALKGLETGTVSRLNSDGAGKLYALYMKLGLAARAKSFRAACDQKLPTLFDPAFERADKLAATSKRQ